MYDGMWNDRAMDIPSLFAMFSHDKRERFLMLDTSWSYLPVKGKKDEALGCYPSETFAQIGDWRLARVVI